MVSYGIVQIKLLALVGYNWEEEIVKPIYV